MKLKNTKSNIELFLERWTHLLYRHPLKSLAILLAVTGILLAQMGNLTFDTSSESLLHKNDPYRVEYDRFREMFGQDRNIIIAITSKNIFTDNFLTKLKALHREIEASSPYFKNVDSLLTARSVSSKDGNLYVGELLASWPKEPVDMGDLRRRVMTNPFYLNHLISADGKMTAIIIETEAVIAKQSKSETDLLSGFSNDSELAPEQGRTGTHYISAKEIREIVAVIEKIIPRYQTDDFDIGFTGSPVVVDIFNRAVADDMIRSSLLAMGVITLLMGLLFRRLSGVCIPIIVVVASVICTLGLMALVGVDIKILTAILPVFILCVGVADSVHILSAFFREYQGGTSKEEAIARAMKHTALAVLLTSLTTAAGLLSFSFAEISAIGEMGIFSAVGVVIALAFTICMLPPILALLPLQPGLRKSGRSLLMDRLLANFAAFSAIHTKKIVIGSAVLLVLATACLPKLHYVDHMLNYFPDRMDVKRDTMRIDKAFSGIIAFEAVIDTTKENGLHDPEILRRIEFLVDRLKNDPTIQRIAPQGIDKIFAITDIVKEINQALHDGEPSFYTIPDHRRLIAQELFLFENSGREELEPIVDAAFSKTRVSIKVPWLDSIGLYRLSDRIGHILDETFKDYAGVNLTGMSFILARTMPATLASMKESYILAAIVISILMVLLAGDMKTGLLAMFPNLLPILTIMGGLSILNIPLDMTLLMIGSIAIGLVVDDTMHFIHHFHRHFNQTRDPRQAAHSTLLGAGRAMLITTLVLSGGFLTLTLAELPNFSRFGILLALTLALALLVDFVLSPALMILAAKPTSHKAEESAAQHSTLAGSIKQPSTSNSTSSDRLSVVPARQPPTKGAKTHAD